MAKGAAYGRTRFTTWAEMINDAQIQGIGAMRTTVAGMGFVYGGAVALLRFSNMGPRPEGLTLERRDNSRGYEPSIAAGQPEQSKASTSGATRTTLQGCPGLSGTHAAEVGTE